MKKKKVKSEDEILDAELIAKGRDAIRDFDESQEIVVTPKKKSSKLISIRIPLSMMRDLKVVAANTGRVGYQKLIKEYISEGLIKDKSRKFEQTKFFVLADSAHTISGSVSEEDGSLENETVNVKENRAAI